ncbi:MAG: RdgB/HAM1 family non-canonical purine NTP pyrophosphatase [Lachnospirales bacterium]
MLEIIIATKNKGKIKEFYKYAEQYDFEARFISMEEVGVNIDVVEDGETFIDNALKKAVEIGKLTGKITMADDSGLAIDFMDGGPGVYSARFLGEDTSSEYKNNHIIDLMKDVPQEERGARFVSAIATYMPDGTKFTNEAYMEGKIATEPKGENGFGYDPIFMANDGNGKTNGQLSLDEKTSISHRGKALKVAIKELKEYLNGN